MLSFRNDLIEIIKPFLRELKNNQNNETFDLNDKKYVPFIQSLAVSGILTNNLDKYRIIDEEVYSATLFISNCKNNKKNNEEEEDDDDEGYIQENEYDSYIHEETEEEKKMKKENEIITKILKEDNADELQKFIRENNKNQINPIASISRSFIDVKKMEFPIMIESIAQNATKCFKYMLINGIENPEHTMNEQNPYNDYDYWKSEHRYEWNCLAAAIYYGRVEMIKLLEEEKGMQKWKEFGCLEAAVTSYRYGLTKTIINQIKEKNENDSIQFFNMGLLISAKNNNIKATELLLDNGADINVKDINILFN